MWLYLRGSSGTTTAGKYGMLIFAAVLLASGAFNIFGPPPETESFMAIIAMSSYLGFGAIAFWLDNKRT
jgi:hypothetical protein